MTNDPQILCMSVISYFQYIAFEKLHKLPGQSYLFPSRNTNHHTVDHK